MDSSSSGMASSSDFVRKLYKMLENPADQHIVRWGNDGSSFVVLENEKFTKHILPKHFKHSNFASFVRQLNKYDFHKVRHNSDEGVPSPYGPNAWEFQHPDFKMNNKTSLENIRRKTPATRKLQQQQYAQMDDAPVPTQQLEMLHAQVMTSQQQIATLENRNVDLQNANANLSREIVRLRDAARNHERILQQILGHLAQGEQRRQSLTLTEAPLSAMGDMMASSTALSAAPFAKRQSFSGVRDDPGQQYLLSAAMQLNRDSNLDGKELDQLANQFHRDSAGNFISPPPDANGSRQFIGSAPVSAASSGTLRLSDADSVVYPISQTNGVDPSYGNASHAPIASPSRKPSSKDGEAVPDWIRQPRILVVDDDAVCCGFGVKIANTLSCFVVDAPNGSDAIKKVQELPPFDLILMDIIMPGMDGLTATREILKTEKNVMIIAMTSNISRNDVASYFEHGMIDLIAKPFTRPALRELLEKRLSHLMRDRPPVVGHEVADSKDMSLWPAQGLAVSTAPGLLSPAPSIQSIHTLVDMMRPNVMGQGLNYMQDATQGTEKTRSLRAITDGEADPPLGVGSGQRRDITLISGGVGEERAPKRQHIQGKKKR